LLFSAARAKPKGMVEPNPDSLRSHKDKPPVSTRVLTWWFGLMAISGFTAGMYGDKRPFGDDVLARPLVLLFATVGVGLLAVRLAIKRPVPEILPERMLLGGCFVALAAFLAGNWFAAHWLAMR
jgi:hypothetical protein